MALSEAAATGAIPALSARTRLLVVAPHPDDETIATGLLIQRVRAVGGEVQIVLLTGGDNNPWPQRWLERRWRLGPADRQRWGQRRHGEMLRALQCLDVPPQALRTMDWPDLGVTGALLQPGNAAVSALAQLIDQFRPSLIALPALADRHPDHSAAHVLIRLAMLGQTEPVALWAYLIHGRAAKQHRFEIQGSSAQRASKHAALEAHASQTALSGGRMRRLAMRPERYAEVAAHVGQSAMVLPWKPPVWLGRWLRLSVVHRHGTQSWRWQDAPLQRNAQGEYGVPLTPDDDQGPYFARLALTLPSWWIFDHWGWCEGTR